MLVHAFPLDPWSGEVAHALALAAQVARQFAPDALGAPVSVVPLSNGEAATWGVHVDIPATPAGAALTAMLRAAEPIVLDDVALGMLATTQSPFLARD